MKSHYLSSFAALAFFLVFAGHQVFAQQRSAGKITGKIVDSQSKQALGFATVSMFAEVQGEKRLVNGSITAENGTFTLDSGEGNFFLLVEFMGYEPLTIPDMAVTREKNSINLGELSLISSAENLDEVVVVGEKNLMELSLDKRIFNVGKDLANAGGTATDILMNLPSINVDPEGNVRLRGSDNVRILIDGKPSGLVT